MRVELPDDQHAMLRDRLTYAQAHGIRQAYYALQQDATLQDDVPLALVKAYVSSWHVLDFDGKAVDLNTPELAPDEVIMEVAKQAADLFGLQKVAVPKEEGGDSLPSTPLEPPSELTTTPSWPTSSSLTSTQDGLGTTS